MYEIFQRPWRLILQFIDQTGMYRMVTGSLIVLAIISILSGFTGLIAYSGVEQLLSLGVVLSVALLANYLWSKILTVSVNYESAVITALIIFFLALPPLLNDWQSLALVALLTLLAISSKFILAWRGQHIVNPAAVGCVALLLLCTLVPSLGYFQAGWWIGTPVLFVPLLVAGALVVTKIRKWPMVGAFLVTGMVVYVVGDWRSGGSVVDALSTFWLSGPSLFLALFMLTEPFTTPPTQRLQIGYGVTVGVLSQLAIITTDFSMTPELALVLGNLLFYPATLRRKLLLPLRSVRELAERTFEFTFTKPSSMYFNAGQYLEWMLPHVKSDSRGERRYFTIASSPTEDSLRLAIRIPEKMSTYKQALMALAPGGIVTASQLAGDFTLPHRLIDRSPSVTKEKLGFIAGGIGITPFRSHLQYMSDTNHVHNTVLFYCNNTAAEISYREEFALIAKKIPLQIVQVLAKEQLTGAEYEYGYVTADMIARRTPDYLERTWYLSGPPGMVNAYGSLLTGMGVKSGRVVKDFFPGLA